MQVITYKHTNKYGMNNDRYYMGGCGNEKYFVFWGF